MNKNLLSGIAATTFAASLAFAAPASAAVTFDPATGTGFVGKGDVQLAFGWTNATLQKNADAVSFAAESTVVTEVSWVCTNINNEHTQERERTTTATTRGVVDAVARDSKKQVTGFHLTGYGLDQETTAPPVTEGPQLNSCPNGGKNDVWVLTPAGEPQVVSSTASLTVHHGGVTHDLPF